MRVFTVLYFNGKASANADVHLTESRYQALFYFKPLQVGMVMALLVGVTRVSI